MNPLKWVGNVLGNAFGTSASVERGVDAIANGFDKLHYGDQEKAEDRARDVSEARSTIVKWISGSSGQNIARRILAFAIAGTWLSMLISSTILAAMSPWADTVEIGYRMLASAGIIGSYAAGLTGAMMLILGFYFAAPHMDKFVDKAMDKFSRSK